MAVNADSVVVELIAENGEFDASVKESADKYSESMDKIERSATKGESAHKKLTASVGNSRIAMLEFQHIARGSIDQIAAGAPLTRVLAQHMGMLGQAVSLAGGSLGSFGAFMGGPFGLALTAAVAGIALLIQKHHEEGDTVESLLKKLQEKTDKTNLSKEADEIWSHTLDGLIDRTDKLTHALEQRVRTQSKLNDETLRGAKGDFAAAVSAQARLEAGGASPAELKKASSEVTKAAIALHDAEQVATEASAAASTDLGEAAKQWIDAQRRFLEIINHAHPELTTNQDISQAVDIFAQAATDAASAGVAFNFFTDQVHQLDSKLLDGSISAKDFGTQVRSLAKDLSDLTQASKNPIVIKAPNVDQIIKQFQQSVVGAEGLGQNRLGSSAAGFGQFMPSTFEGYFKKLFPQQAAGMTNAQIDAMRNVKETATAVIEAATKDYVTVLKSAGQAITKANLYAVHVLGQGDAAKFFAGSPDQSVKSALGGGKHADAVIKGNPFLGGTIAQAQAAFAKRIGDSSAIVSAGAVAIAKALDDERERLARYLAEKSAAEEDVVTARKGLAKEAEDNWAFETAANIASHKHVEDQIDAQVASGKLLEDASHHEAADLKKINDERARFIQQLVDQRLRQAQFARETENLARGRDFQTAKYETETEQLQSLEGLARTAEQRRRIEDRLIDLQFAEEKLKNDYIIAWAERVKANQDATEAEKADAALAEQIAQMHNGTLGARQANAHDQNSRQNASPLQAYFDGVPEGAKEIDAAFQQIAVNGLQSFNDALANAIVNFTSLRDVARTVLQQLAGDLIKFALQQIELHTIGQLLATTSTATTVAQMAAIAAAAAPAAAMVSLATYGTNAIPAQAGIASTVGLATILGTPKAYGGRIAGFGGQRSDMILTPSSPGEYMLQAPSARSIGYSNLDYMNATGRIPSPSNGVASSGGFGSSPADFAKFQTMLDSAIRAMPPIILNPTLDSGEFVEKGLKTTRGGRAVNAHIAENPTHVKAALNRP
jgi:hypothetical protein